MHNVFMYTNLLWCDHLKTQNYYDKKKSGWSTSFSVDR